MTISPCDTERSTFIKAYPHLDLTEVPDAWGSPIFKHSHVQALWDGWFARATLDHGVAHMNLVWADIQKIVRDAYNEGFHP